MKSQRSKQSIGKGKQVMNGDLDQQAKDIKRDPNWSESETFYLLHAVKHIHAKRGRKGFSFNSAERNEIFRLFKDSLPDTTRPMEKCENRLKVLQKMFKVCHELASMSGGGWDDENHRPLAPSWTEYVEMVKAKGSAGSFLLTKSFPWYRDMLSMVGKQSAKGDELNPSKCPAEPINVVDDPSVLASEQGSSDDPDEGKHDGNCSVESPSRGGGSSYARPGQDSDDTRMRTGNSGSKRKSTDESAGTNSRRRRYRDRAQMRIEADLRLAQAGEAMANCMEQETKRRSKADAQRDQCIDKLDALGIPDEFNDWALEVTENNPGRQYWILTHDRQAILNWIQRNMK